jgi:hypothetical protein
MRLCSSAQPKTVLLAVIQFVRTVLAERLSVRLFTQFVASLGVMEAALRSLKCFAHRWRGVALCLPLAKHLLRDLCAYFRWSRELRLKTRTISTPILVTNVVRKTLSSAEIAVRVPT